MAIFRKQHRIADDVIRNPRAKIQEALGWVHAVSLNNRNLRRPQMADHSLGRLARCSARLRARRNGE